MTPIPDWIPAEAWAGYVEMRKKKKAVMTPRATELRIADLEKFRDAGHDIAAILDQSTVNGWTDLYEPKGGTVSRSGGIQALGKKGQATADNAKAWIESDQSIDAIKEAKKRFAALFSGLADYYGAEVSKASLGLYWEGLRQYDYNAIEKAAWAHTQSPDENGRWMPKISDLTKVLQGSTKDQASIAWSKVDRAVRTIGTNFDVAFDDSLIHRVIQDMGGWIQIGHKSDDDWPFIAKEFENRYRSYKMRDEQPEYPTKMIGAGSASAATMGMEYTQGTVLIGDEQKAIAVIKGGSQNAALSFKKAEAPQIGNSAK